MKTRYAIAVDKPVKLLGYQAFELSETVLIATHPYVHYPIGNRTWGALYPRSTRIRWPIEDTLFSRDRGIS